jgi:RNA polymerase sigma factor (sigma-70 family)
VVSHIAIQGVENRAESRNTAFLKLYEQYGPALARLAGAYVVSPQDREDLIQEIAAAIWKALPSFRGEASGRTWLYRIAHNVAISASAKLRTRGNREITREEPFETASAEATPEQQMIIHEKRRVMLGAIRNLPAPDRQVMVLHLEGLSYGEIEEVTGLSQGVVAARLTRIREKLRKAVRDKEVGDGR